MTEQKTFPWDSHPSIFEHLHNHIPSNSVGLKEEGFTLPDEERINATSRIRWAAGAMDGVSTHHVAGQTTDHASELLQLFQSYFDAPTAVHKLKIHEYLIEHGVVSLIDPFIELLREQEDLNHQRLYELVYSFATESPDREPVKFGMAILGVYAEEQNQELFHVLGRHDEFTLFAAVAFGNYYEDGEVQLWNLAKNVEGWGRIHIVERFIETQNPEIQDWMLREGYKNSVMYEYLAYTCAVGGKLLSALSEEEVDDKLLESAGELISSLILGGPAECMDDYEDGAIVVEQYLNHLQPRMSTLREFMNVNSIRGFLKEEADWDFRESKGWSPFKRTELLNTCEELLQPNRWKNLVVEQLQSEDEYEFHVANNVAHVLKIETWDVHWKRLQAKPTNSGRWWNVLSVSDENNFPMLLEFAEKHLPLDEIATGPASEMGLGEDFESHSCLEYLLQELDCYPGKGESLLHIGLQSPVIRGRNLALRVLDKWGREHWSEETLEVLQEAVNQEPEPDVRQRIENLIAGRELEANLSD